MRKYLLAIPLALLVCFIVGCQQQKAEEPESIMLTDEDIAAIRASTDLYASTWMSGDIEARLALYTDDAVLMPPNAPRVQGKDAIRTIMESMPIPKSASLTINEIDGRGDIAYVIGTVSTTYEMEGMPEPIQDVGKYIEIRVKEEDGSWLIARDIFNSDIPLPEDPEK